MNHRTRAALAAAHLAFLAKSTEKVHVEMVRLPTEQTAASTVRRRLAINSAVTLAPVLFEAPRPDTDQTIEHFVREEFAEARRKRDRAA